MKLKGDLKLEKISLNSSENIILIPITIKNVKYNVKNLLINNTQNDVWVNFIKF